MIYRRLFRPVLFTLSAEVAHHATLGALGFLQRIPLALGALRARFAVRDPSLSVDALGLSFPSPVGLAAGLDKNAAAFEAFGAFGFGFVEVGTVTAHEQPGNPRPRLFRLPVDRAVINRMGFNNDGATRVAARIRRVRKRRTLLGINLGKSKVTPNEDAARDYATSAKLLVPYADYVVLNVSSPNTPGLRDLQTVSQLRPLLAIVRETLDSEEPSRRVPLLVKIAPDLADEDIDAIADLALELRLDGIIATNTTIQRSGLATPQEQVDACGNGGLSGPPVKARALEVLRRLRARVGNRITLVSVGGIANADDAWARICAGATLVQVYTALIYEGPMLAREIALGLAQRAKAAGFASITAAIGRDATSGD